MKKKPFQLGSLTLPSNVFYAPLAGCSDFPFRKMSAKYHPGLIYCEMVKMDAIIRHDEGTFRMLDYSEDMHPIGGQICGSKPEIAGQAAKIIEDLGFDVIDLNCGCPVDKITKDGSGSGMLKNPQKIGDVIANMVAAVKIPVTVKIRAGWDPENINAEQITEIAEAAGAQAICIHGRTRMQAYKGPANWDYIKNCKARAKKIKIIGNGDVFTPEAAIKMFEYTGCDAVLVSRGTMGQPWIAEEIYRLMDGQEARKRDYEECRLALFDHFEAICNYKTEKGAILDMRRVGCWYFKKSSGTREFRGAISKAITIKEIKHLIENFAWNDTIVNEELEEWEE